MMLYFDHWSKVPAGLWRWPNFSAEEIACRGTGKVILDLDAMDKLQALRDQLGVPLILNSAGRSPEHNRAVGGAAKSEHLKGRAFDVSMTNHDPELFELAARAVGFTGFGFYPRNNFIHIDTGHDREWGDRWKSKRDPRRPNTRPRFSPPPVQLPERMRDDPIAKGGAVIAGGSATALGALVAAIGDLSPVAQIVAVSGGLFLVVGLVVIARHKLSEWRPF
ncbi:D-Ala-D-Ala carboxypeptidase family metallohydrolase [Falsiruegeria litorea]|uniref:D-Ala-D-Ala carboxypeptidase family metallohydrolase n=1 Tax=Falsiruegeria litorea TaxID=1280831 RepID=UPI001BFD043B|nr:D-Ala-D-Ala carboxypeptidase family metallohydrolase [Falsiruegeria litorea]MBT8169864.1 DUF882 domain-containing protein [Falsiruegeria litorea]